jgi:hypothetical protein
MLIEKTKKIFFLSISTLLFLISCEKLVVPEGTPYCIKNKIKQIKNDAVRNPSAEIWEYDYKGQPVYYFPPYCCDIPSELYDNNCNLICQPDGGITGVGDGNCTDFFTTRTNGKLIWKDTR